MRLEVHRRQLGFVDSPQVGSHSPIGTMNPPWWSGTSSSRRLSGRGSCLGDNIRAREDTRPTRFMGREHLQNLDANRGHESSRDVGRRVSVLECGSPLPLWTVPITPTFSQSARGLPHSKTLTRRPTFREDSWSQCTFVTPRSQPKFLRGKTRIHFCTKGEAGHAQTRLPRGNQQALRSDLLEDLLICPGTCR